MIEYANVIKRRSSWIFALWKYQTIVLKVFTFSLKKIIDGVWTDLKTDLFLFVQKDFLCKQ